MVKAVCYWSKTSFCFKIAANLGFFFHLCNFFLLFSMGKMIRDVLAEWYFDPQSVTSLVEFFSDPVKLFSWRDLSMKMCMRKKVLKKSARNLAVSAKGCNFAANFIDRLSCWHWKLTYWKANAFRPKVGLKAIVISILQGIQSPKYAQRLSRLGVKMTVTSWYKRVIISEIQLSNVNRVVGKSSKARHSNHFSFFW